MTVLIELVFMTLAISLALAVITRILVDPKKMKEIKTEMEFYKEKVNKFQKEGNKDETKKYTELMLGTSKKQFQLSMKSLIVTMIVVIIALGYIHQTYDGFAVNLDQSKIEFRGNSYGLKTDQDSFSLDMGDGFKSYRYEDIVKFSDATWKVDKKDDTLHFSLIVAAVPFTFPILGNYLNWFWLYFLISIPSSLLFRKLLGVE